MRNHPFLRCEGGLLARASVCVCVHRVPALSAVCSLCVCATAVFPSCPCVLCARADHLYKARAQPPCLSTNRPATPQQPSTSSPSRPHLASPASHQSPVMGITSDALHLRDYQPRAYWNTPPSARTWSRSKAGPIVVYLGT